METGYPDVRSHTVFGASNARNLAIVLLAPVPAIVAAWTLFTWFGASPIPPDPGLSAAASPDDWAAALLHRPVLTANLLFFVNVCLGFQILAWIQRSTWLIDPYWTLLPPLLAVFYWAHPLAAPDGLRSAVALGLLAIWSLRLTHSYLRRERWRLGFREDWRFAKARAESSHFWWFQFFYVYVAQQLMLVGLTLPYWAVHFRAAPFSWIDATLTVLALTGLAIAHSADTTLDAFMRENEARAAAGQERVRLLERGLWRLSRHPNYFGEQLFWWSVAGFGVRLGEPWVAIGTAFNSAVLALVTVMTERRMLASPERRELYAAYRRRTSVWVPWPRKADADRAPTAAAGSGS